MAIPPFRFREFAVEQAEGVHPVGTDSVLLGAWAPVPERGAILDAGCGTGVVALMLAQRTSNHVQVHALDVHAESVALARRNAENSPWKGRMHVWEGDAARWDGQNHSFDLLVANPPYFPETVKSPNPERARSRHMSYLRPHELIELADRLLAPEGKLCVILPGIPARHLAEAGACSGWYTTRRLDVRARSDKKTARTLQVLERTPLKFDRDILTIYRCAEEYSEEFVRLTAAFYR